MDLIKRRVIALTERIHYINESQVSDSAYCICIVLCC